MFLSRLVIHNYRSIKKISLKFETGKNIIIGKNNTGKSNIVKAINLILGESLPSYHKTNNITKEDFYLENIENPIYIFCELERNDSENYNYEELSKSIKGYYIYGPNKGEPFDIKADPESELFTSQLSDIFSIDFDELDYTKKKYISCKDPDTIRLHLDNKDILAYIFKAEYLESGKINKDLRLLYRQKCSSKWILSSYAPFRNELLQSAIIPSFRDPNNQLRIADYTWYGKLLKNYTQKNNESFLSACETVKTASNEMFEEIISAIKDSHIDIAFPGNNYSIQCSPKITDAHKLALIYIDDGFNSLLTYKGSGIQSAVIIGLFDFYTRKISVCNNSLLIIEEPELYLHPHGRRVISHRLEKYLENNKNQVVITTHSPEFVSTGQNCVNLISVTKTTTEGTIATNVKFTDAKHLQVINQTQNSELFFADTVILVEGGEKYILPAIAKQIGTYNPDLGQNWLNNYNISVISVGGKSQFINYLKILKQIPINVYIMADFDFIIEGLNDLLTQYEDNDLISELHKIKTEIGKIEMTFTNPDLPPNAYTIIDSFHSDIQKLGYNIEKSKIVNMMKNSKKFKKLTDIPDEKLQGFCSDFISKIFEKYHIFILKGELENYYKPHLINEFGKHSIKGKETRPLFLISHLLDDEKPINYWINDLEYKSFMEQISDAMNPM